MRIIKLQWVIIANKLLNWHRYIAFRFIASKNEVSNGKIIFVMGFIPKKRFESA